MQVLVGDHRGSMEVKINAQIGAGAVFVSSQMFVFGGVALVANSVGHLGQVRSFASGWIVRFGSMEYTANFHGELIFTNLVPRQVEEQHEPLASHPMSDQVQE